MYWPYQQSPHLNKAVAELFIQTYQKFFTSLTNRASHKIPLDILTPKLKRKLLLHTLVQIEIIILDIIELNLLSKDIEEKSSQIIYDLICKTILKTLNKEDLYIKNLTIDLTSQSNQIFFRENNYLFKSLMTYLIFGSKYIKDQVFKFEKIKTPKYHVKTLFEHFIIQMSNIVILNILEKKLNNNNTSLIINNQTDINFNNKSIRELSIFQNNLFSYNWTYYYIFYPQNVYCNQYKIWMFSSKGIIYRYIYADRYTDYLTLSPSMISSIIYLELQDFIIPKIKFLITLLGKLIIYISLEFINKSIQILLNQIIRRFNTKREV